MDRSHEGSPRSDLARHWSLDPAVDYLNHGSFGACPTAVLAFQSELRRQLATLLREAICGSSAESTERLERT